MSPFDGVNNYYEYKMSGGGKSSGSGGNGSSGGCRECPRFRVNGFLV